MLGRLDFEGATSDPGTASILRRTINDCCLEDDCTCLLYLEEANWSAGARERAEDREHYGLPVMQKGWKT